MRLQVPCKSTDAPQAVFFYVFYPHDSGRLDGSWAYEVIYKDIKTSLLGFYTP